MAELLIFIAAGYIGVGISRAWAYAKAERRMFQTLIADPAPAAGTALRIRLAIARLPAWKRWSFGALRFLGDLTAWPIFEVLEYRDRRRRPDPWKPEFRDTRWPGGEEELTPEYASRRARRCSLVTCGASVFLIVTASAFVTRPDEVIQIKVLTGVFVLGTAARQAQDLLADKFLSGVARRSGLPVLHAYRDVLLAAAADLLTLSLCSVLLLRWAPGQPLRSVWFREQLLAVVTGGHVAGLRRALTESPSAVLVTVASITFYASLLGPLWNTVGRRRSGDDLMAAAESALRHGRPDRARRLLERGRSKTSKKPSVTAVSRVEGLIALSDGKVLDAWTAAQTLVRQYRPDQDLNKLRQREDGLFVVQHWCRELKVTPRPTIGEIARDVPVRDSMMACLMGQDPDALLPGSPAGARAVALEAVLDPHAWPLTFSVAHELDGDLAAAAQLLAAADRVTGLDRLWRNQLARGLQAELDRNQLAADARAERIKGNARALLADVAASDITTWPEWHRSVFSRAMSVPLVFGEAVGLDEQLTQALISTRRAIAGEFGEDAELQVLRNNVLSKGRRDLSDPP
jgi:hypothetical protein